MTFRQEGACNICVQTPCSSGTANNTSCCSGYSVLPKHHTCGTVSWPRTQFARYLETSVILEALCFREMSVTLVAVDLSFAWDARGNGRTSIARRVTLELYTSLATLFTCRVHLSLGHSCCQVGDDVVMRLVIQQVDPLW